jgi:hypothetical protein
MKKTVELRDPVDSGMRPIRHVRNLFWWAAIVLVAFVAIEASSTGETPKLYERAGPGVENEAFVALRLPRVRGAAGGEVTADRVQKVIESLHQSGHSTIHFRDVEAFYRHGTPLPKRPILWIVPEAWTETVDAVDAVLEKTKERGVLFLDVAEIARVNLSLVSRMRLAELARTGRWEIGIATCMAAGPNAGVPTTEALAIAKRQIQEWVGLPVRAADCRSGLGAEGERDAWIRATRESGLSVGFVRGRAATNYRIDFPLALQSIPVTDGWRPSNAAERLQAFLPRREVFADDFRSPQLDPSWVVDAGAARADGGSMVVSNGGKELGLVRLGGTENWRDAAVEVELATRPNGQFWIFLRRRGSNEFVRLGQIDGEVLLQRSMKDGGTRQLARKPIPRGKLKLSFQVVGNRVEARANGVPLTDRPQPIPASLAFGPVSLAVWDADEEASARIASFSAKPLPRLAAIVSPRPSAAEWRELHRRAESLTELSPRAYAWTEAGPKVLGTPDSGLVIFAHFHRLSLRPTVSVDVTAPARDYAKLAEQILEWSQSSAYDGVNLLIHSKEGASEPPRRLLATLLGLKRAMRSSGKELSITFAGDEDRPIPPTLLPWEPFRADDERVLASFSVVQAG